MAEDKDLYIVRDAFNFLPVPAASLPLQFTEVKGDIFWAEFAIKGMDIIFHFFGLNGNYPIKLKRFVDESFQEILGDAGMDRVVVEKVTDEDIIGGTTSVFVKAVGYADNPVAYSALIPDVFDRVHEKLKAIRVLR